MNRVTMNVDGYTVAWVTSDGRTGVEAHMGPGKYGPTLVKVLTDLAIIGPWGTTPGWTIEVMYPGGTRFMFRGPGLDLMAQG